MDSTQFTKARTKVLRWSQQRLADELGMARNSVSRMESGVMPIERRTELALRWLMYSECNIVEQPSSPTHPVSEPVPCNMVEQPKSSHSPGGVTPDSVSSTQLVDMFSDALSSFHIDPDREPQFRSEMIERYNIIVSDFPSLRFDADFLPSYLSFGPKVWLNIRVLRGAVRQYLESHQS